MTASERVRSSQRKKPRDYFLVPIRNSFIIHLTGKPVSLEISKIRVSHIWHRIILPRNPHMRTGPYKDRTVSILLG